MTGTDLQSRQDGRHQMMDCWLWIKNADGVINDGRSYSEIKRSFRTGKGLPMAFRRWQSWIAIATVS